MQDLSSIMSRLLSNLGCRYWYNTYRLDIQESYQKYRIYFHSGPGFSQMVLEIIINNNSNSEEYNQICLNLVKEAFVKYKFSGRSYEEDAVWVKYPSGYLEKEPR